MKKPQTHNQLQREPKKPWWYEMIVIMKIKVLPKQNDKALCSTLPLGIKRNSHLFAP